MSRHEFKRKEKSIVASVYGENRDMCRGLS